MNASSSQRTRNTARAAGQARVLALAAVTGVLLSLASLSAGAAVIPLAGRYADEVRSVPMAVAEQARRPAAAASRDTAAPASRHAPSAVQAPAALRPR